jgi:hypothetical protein
MQTRHKQINITCQNTLCSVLLLSYQIPIPGINYVALEPKSESWFDFNIEQLETKRSNEV